jgi:glycosyltransferase involved in cell wall biosynthesis
MSDNGARIAVLVPCLDEEQTIGSVVKSFRDALPTSTVYVYDNNSTDRTSEVASEAGAVVRRAAVPGKGNVVRRMFADVEADVYLLVDGDGTYDASIAPQLVDGVLSDGNDLVHVRRVAVDAGAYRRGHPLGNRLLTWLVRFLFSRQVSDVLSGYRAMSRRFVKSFAGRSTGFDIEIEIMVDALELDVPVAEVAGSYRGRPAGSSSKLGTYSDGLRILATVIRLLRHGRPLMFFGVLGVVLAAVAVALGIPILETFLHTHKVPRFPTAILATGLVVLSAISFASGLLLDTVTRGRREAKILRYLEIPGPLAEVT